MLKVTQQNAVIGRVKDAPEALKLAKVPVDSAGQHVQ